MTTSPFKKTLTQLLGNRCAGCEQPHVAPLCQVCLLSIEKPDNYCLGCGTAMSGNSIASHCKDCLAKPLSFVRLHFFGNYDNVLSNIIVRAKLARELPALLAIRHLMHKHLQSDPTLDGILPDKTQDYHLLPMPIPTLRLMQRGYNLPLFMAKTLSEHCHLPILPPTAVKLPFYTKKQGRLSKAERQKNRHSYQINHKLPEKILIIDDIYTTGTTLTTLAEKLREKGIKTLAVTVLSRSQSDTKKT